MSGKNILVVNDDGIDSPGLWELARLAQGIAGDGQVVVIAPASVQSGASHRVTIKWPTYLQNRTDLASKYGVSGAYAVQGTPADCTSIGLGARDYIGIDHGFDLVLSGVNNGLNVGYDVAYSGTVGAAMEAAMRGVPAIAFSQTKIAPDYSIIEAHFNTIMAELLDRIDSRTNDAGSGIWNVNIPGCSLDRLSSILYDRSVAHGDVRPYDGYKVQDSQDSLTAGDLQGNTAAQLFDSTYPVLTVQPNSMPLDEPMWAQDISTDLGAICANYVSVGWVPSMV